MNAIKMINESAKYGHEGNVEEIYDLGEINIIDIKTKDIFKVNTGDIIKVVNDAIFYMQKKYSYLYLFLNAYKVMYVPTFPSKICDSMCVDSNNNLWINMNFVYNECAMNKDRVFGILFHEMFHIFLEHLIRFNTMFPESTKAMMSPDIWKSANTKANLAMDYEINASMVADGIVSEDFWKIMGGLYKKEYIGKTWEEIYTKYGDKEYREWLDANGQRISEDEMKILDAIEKAAKVLKDPTATEEDKARANKELQKTIDKILGRDRDDDIQDILEEMKSTRLGDIGDIGEKMQDVIDDLYKSPSKMSDEQFNNLMDDIDQMVDEMVKNASKIADAFNKSEEDVLKDIENMRQTMKDSISQLRRGKMTKDEKKDIADKIKDSLEDVISSDVDKKRNAETPLKEYLTMLLKKNDILYYDILNENPDVLYTFKEEYYHFIRTLNCKNDRNEEVENINLASQMRVIKEALSSYIISYHSEIEASCNNTTGECTPDMDKIVSEFLPFGYDEISDKFHIHILSI